MQKSAAVLFYWSTTQSYNQGSGTLHPHLSKLEQNTEVKALMESNQRYLNLLCLANKADSERK